MACLPPLAERLIAPGCWAADLVACPDAGDGGSYLARALATRTDEHVTWAKVTGETLSFGPALPGVRPALAHWQGKLVVGVIAPHDGALVPVLHIGEATIVLAVAGPCYTQCCLAAAGERLYMACVEHDTADGMVHLGYLDCAMRLQRVAHVRGQCCALAAHGETLAAVWIDGDRVFFSANANGGFADPILLREDRFADAPCLAIDAAQQIVAAWHGPVGDAALHWPRVVRLDGMQPEAIDPPVCARLVPRHREAAGENQGWEFLTMALDAGGTIWLAGRTAHGYRMQAFSDGAWGDAVDVGCQGWGGRSRTCAFVVQGGCSGLVYATMAGISLAPCPDPQRAQKKAPRITPAISRPLTTPAFQRTGEGPREWPREWPRPLFGDPHQHTIHSDGLGSLEGAYRRARDRYAHDFVAITDHDVFTKGAIGPLTWAIHCQLADAFNAPGQFVTLIGYEFTGARLPGPGHKCVYFGDRVPATLPAKDRAALTATLRQYGGIAVPHHIGWTGMDAADHDPLLQPVWEICSVHGAYESGTSHPLAPRGDVVLPGQFVIDALAAGLRFGFVGGSDSHGLSWHHGVGRRADPLTCGLTAVYAAPTRHDIFSALGQRHCYATSGARILLHLDAAGATMGQDLDLPTPEIFVAALGSAPIAELALIVDGVPVAQTAGEGLVTLRHRLSSTTAWSYAYARVRQADGQMAWASPLFRRSSGRGGLG